MYTQTSKQQQAKNHLSGARASKNQTTIHDNRPEVVSQLKLQQAIWSSSNAMQLQACQDMADNCVQRKEFFQAEKPNHTGLPNQLKAGVESLSGISMDHVKVNYNSGKPAQLQAHAYAEGSTIHVAPGQEKHLPHEAWHVVQQSQGRVKPTAQLKGVSINDDAGLENEADVMGAKAMNTNAIPGENKQLRSSSQAIQAKLIQLYTYNKGVTRKVKVTGTGAKTREFEECLSNSVEYTEGEALRVGSGTGTASWAGWLTNKKGGNNATQLHVVNKLWGGKGEADSGNIVPGTPAENSHHLHQAENKFKECFGGGVAKENCKYVCTATPKYGNAVDVSDGNAKEFGDPTLDVNITYNGVTTNHPVTDGAEGLVFNTGPQL